MCVPRSMPSKLIDLLLPSLIIFPSIAMRSLSSKRSKRLGVRETEILALPSLFRTVLSFSGVVMLRRAYLSAGGLVCTGFELLLVFVLLYFFFGDSEMLRSSTSISFAFSVGAISV